MSAGLPAKTARARGFFDRPDYVTENPNITVRSLLLRRMLGSAEGARILDAGCGDGSLSLQFLPDASKLTLLDVSSEMLARARLATPKEFLDRVEFVNDDLAGFTPTREYDLVLFVGVLAHVPSVEQTVRKLSQVLAPDGRCALQLTDSSRLIPRLIWRYERARGRLRGSPGAELNHTTTREVVDLAARTGLALVERQNYSFLLPGSGLIPYAWRLRLEQRLLDARKGSARGIETMLLFEKAAR